MAVLLRKDNNLNIFLQNIGGSFNSVINKVELIGFL